MKKILLGMLIGSGVMFGVSVLAQVDFSPNPLFDPLPVGKDGLSLVSYTQEQKDMTMLYGRLDYIVKQLNDLQNTCAKH